MDSNRISKIDLNQVPTPCYLVDEEALKRNLHTLKTVQDVSGGKILLALKAFAMHALFPLIREYLYGVCASSPYEARLGKEEFGKMVHTYGPAYSPSDIDQLIETSDYLIFNSESQWKRYKEIIPSSIRCGYRINPGYSEIEIDLYDPCSSHSRLGIPFKNFPEDLSGITGLHFHALCEQNADTLQRILEVVEEKYGKVLSRVDWINMGGGHHITRSDYDVDLLIELIRQLRSVYSLEVFLEPGEAIALDTGVLIASVLDIVDCGIKIAILDTSAEAHMPDVLAMPYRPVVIGAGESGQYAYTYRLAGMTCLAGDVIGDYSFRKPLEIGDKLIFTDMAHYTMVKNNMFNGIKLPSLVLYTSDHRIQIIKRFSYEDYKSRLS